MPLYSKDGSLLFGARIAIRMSSSNNFFFVSQMYERGRLLSSTFSLSVAIFCRLGSFIPSGQLCTDCESLEMVGYFFCRF